MGADLNVSAWLYHVTVLTACGSLGCRCWSERSGAVLDRLPTLLVAVVYVASSCHLRCTSRPKSRYFKGFPSDMAAVPERTSREMRSAYACKGQRKTAPALINTVFAQESSEAAKAQWDIVADQLQAKFPKLAAMLADAKYDVLAFMDFPKAHRMQIASTNPLERLNAEVKRRTDVVGIFPNDASIVRLVGALLLEQNDEWQLQRRYMQLEGLKTVSDNPLHRISAVVNN